jgi:UDP-N-acetylmuramoyl-L-alanyl-D-glutamate--2,6-diaminopimelate ligase
VGQESIFGVLSNLCATLTGHPENGLSIVGVTGTNGKTSVATLVASLARHCERSAASIGTLTNSRTTPASPELFRTLRTLRDSFTSDENAIVAMEVSSHALDQHRVEGITFEVSAFTNLTHDHLDYHRDMETYFEAKAKLFVPGVSQHAVIWVDDPYGMRLADLASIPVTRVQRTDASEVTLNAQGSTYFWRGQLINTHLIGDYNVDNALVAMTIMSELGVSDAAIARAMQDVEAIPGRLEVVNEKPFSVIVDYAHTPDGLERVLASARELTPDGRLLTVVGCGGDRDRAKRPLMGSVASIFSDLTVVTSDNPRSEDPDAIIDEVISGALPGRDVRRESDRREAIRLALGEAREGDTVVIAGKGHEVTQEVNGVITDFDDRIVAREVLRGLHA